MKRHIKRRDPKRHFHVLCISLRAFEMAHCVGTFTIKSTAFYFSIPNHRTKQSIGFKLRNLKFPISRRKETPVIVFAKQKANVQMDPNPPQVSPAGRSKCLI